MAQDENPPNDRRMCGVGSIAHEPLHPDLMVVEEPKPKFVSKDSKPYKPYKILFVYDQDIKLATKLLIEKAAESANARLGRAVKSPVLDDVRLPQLWNSKFDFLLQKHCTVAYRFITNYFIIVVLGVICK